jgi:hypothetical protein
MQNRNNNIEERLQIINDYIQRTMDALNATRQVVQGLSASAGYPSFVSPSVSGLAHTSFVPQFIQTPFGVVAVNSPLSAAQIPQVAGQFAPFGYGYGLQHTGFVPQIQAWPMNVSSLGVSPFGVSSLGVPSVGIPQVGVNYNYGWPTGLNHSSFVPQHMAPWGVPMSVASQWPVNANVVQHGVPGVAL